MLLINGVFFHVQRPSTSELKIPNQNIAFFLKDEPKSITSAQIKPIKKIVLSIAIPLSNGKILAEEERAVLPSVAANVIIPKITKSKSQEAKSQEPEKIPLQFTAQNTLALPTRAAIPEAKTITNLKPKKTEEIVLSQGDIKTNPSKTIPGMNLNVDNNDDDNSIDYDSDDEDYVFEKNDKNHPSRELVLAQANIVQNKVSSNLAAFPKEAPHEAISDVSESDNDSDEDYGAGNDDYSTDEPQDLPIPLQRDYANVNNYHEIQIKKEAEKNQIAMVKGSVPVKSMVSEKNNIAISEDQNSPDPKNKEWENMAQKNESDNPWIAAKGTKYPKNNTVLGEDYYKNIDTPEVKAALSGNKNAISPSEQGIQLVSDMVKNILIPIPDDILNDEDLTPQLESSNKTNPKEPATTEYEHTKEKKEAAQDLKQEIGKNGVEASNKASKGGLLNSITSIFSSSPAATTEIGSVEKEEKGLNRYVQPFTSKILRTKGAKPNKILPAEMRLSFQPNRAEISGTTLKWIQAFANKVNIDSSVILEIRIDGASSFALQQKRLNLLHNILTNKGVDYSKINTVFTTREPNSFIIRTVKVNSNIDKDIKGDKDSAANYQPW